MRAVRTSRWLALVATTSCSAAPPPVDDPVAPPATIDVGDEAPSASVTGWHYHPQQMARILDGAALPDGRWLLVGELGERWLTTVNGKRATAASHRPGEPLEHVVPWRGRTPATEGARWLFIGESGRTYFSHEPLGPLTPGPRAPRSVADVASTPGGALAVDLVGGPLRFDGAAWETLATSPRLFAVARGRSGALVGMALPERLWRSDDAGTSWSPLPAEPRGAHRLTTSRTGDVVLDGPAGAWRLASDDGSVTPAANRPVDPRELTPEGGRGPSARAIARNEATFTNEGYVEILARVIPADPEAGRARPTEWRVRRGALGAPLEERALPLERSCRGFVVAASGPHLWIGCGDANGNEAMRVRLLHSPDRGDHLSEVAIVVSSLPERMSLACDGDGVAFISAACPTHRPGCSPSAPLRVRPDGRIEPTVAPELVGPSFEPAVGANGRSYFLGERGKDGRVALFVSDDDERYRAQPLEPPRGYRGPWDRELTTRRSLHPAADGTVGIAMHGTSPLYAVADRRGQVTHVASLPEHCVAFGGHGRHVLALTRPPNAWGYEAQVSNDAGASFRPLSMPMALGADEVELDPELACGAPGCVFDKRVSHLGWNVRGPVTPALDAPELPPLDPRPATRTPISCETSGAPSALHPAAFPSADEVMRGDVAWSTLRHVRATGEVEVAAMNLARGRLERHRLMPRAQPRSHWALDFAIRREGYAAVRAKLPKGGRDAIADAPMRLEVAWLDSAASAPRRGVIPDAGTFRDDDVTPGDTPMLITGLIALTPPGLVLRPSDSRRDAWLLDGDGAVVARHDVPELPPTSSPHTTLEALRVSDTTFATEGYHLDGQADASTWATAPMGGGTAVLTTIAPPALGRLFETSVSYRANVPGALTMLLDPRHDDAYGYFAPLLDSGELGEAEPLPTQRTLADPPRGCTSSDRRDGVRVVAPFQSGTRHPVVVHLPEDGKQRGKQGGAGSLVMLTDRAVLYGTKDAPCLAGWIARSIGTGAERVAVIGGDLKRAWLFEEATSATLTHRPMRCRLTPDAEIDPLVWQQDGTIATAP